MSVVKTIILQAIAHVWRHQRITGISAYFDCMRITNTIDSQKSEDRDITDKLPLLLFTVVSDNQSAMNAITIFFHTGKI
jgi:hypothetical protein